MTAYQNWSLIEETRVATLTLNRPEAMNSLTAETLYELRDISARLRARKDLWVVIVQGRWPRLLSTVSALSWPCSSR